MAKMAATLRKYGVNTVILIAAVVVVFFGVFEPGKTMAKNLLADSPVLFYSVFLPIAGIFMAWAIQQVRRRTK